MPPHPGPTSSHSVSGTGDSGAPQQQQYSDIDILSNNITSLLGHIDHVHAHYSADVMCFQEATVPVHQRSYAYQKIKDLGYTGCITGNDPELQHTTAGIATMVAPTVKYEEPIIKTDGMRKVLKSGRLQVAMIVLPSGACIHVYNLYGWVNGHQDHAASTRTNDIIGTVRAEHEAQGCPPAIVLGDFNANVTDLQDLDNWINTGQLHDPGATASRFQGGQDCAPTCFAHDISGGTRRDYIMVTADLVPYIQDYQVIKDASINVHALLRLSLKMPTCNPTKRKLQRDDNFYDCLRKVVAKHLNTDVDNIPQQVWKEHVDEMHQAIDKMLTRPTTCAKLNRARNMGDTDALWEVWNDAVVLAIARHIKYKQHQYAQPCKMPKYKAHGKPNIVRVPIFTTQADQQHNAANTKHDDRAIFMHKQIQRLANMKGVINKIIKEPSHNNLQEQRRLQDTWANFIAKLITCPHDYHMLTKGEEPPNNIAAQPGHLVRITRYYNAYTQIRQKYVQDQVKEQQNQHKQNILGERYQRTAYKKLRPRVPKQPSVLTDDQGKYIVHPDQIDQRLRDTWDKVFKGNSSDHFQLIQNYYNQYKSTFFTTTKPVSQTSMGSNFDRCVMQQSHQHQEWMHGDHKNLACFLFSHSSGWQSC